MLLLSERQMCECWEPSKKQYSFGKRGALDSSFIIVVSMIRKEFEEGSRLISSLEI